MQLSNKVAKIVYFLVIPFITITALLSRVVLLGYFIIAFILSIGFTIFEK